MKTNKKTILFSILLCLLPCLLGIYLWDQLPDSVPTHFDLHNQPDQYSSKAFAVFGLPCLLAAISVLCIWGTGKDPRQEKQSEVLRQICNYIPGVISCIVAPTVFYTALGKNVNISLILSIFTGLLFLIIGNYLPKCRRNYTIGIKLPWTLADDNNWNYTHRIGGVCFMLAGLVIIAGAFVHMSGLVFLILPLIIGVPIYASYRYYKKHKDMKGANDL